MRKSDQTFPLGDIRAIRNFPKPHERYFVLAGASTFWANLLRSDTALALIVAHGDEFAGEQFSLAKLNASKEDLCALAGFPGSERTVLLLRRFVIEPDVSLRCLLLLRWLLVQEPYAYEVLEAKADISADDLIHLAIGERSFDNWGDLRTLEWFFALPAALRHFIGHLWADATEYCSTIADEILGPVKTLSDFRDQAEAIAWLKGYSEAKRCIEMAELEVEHPCWPEPPVAGTPTIQPIRTSDELDEECLRLDHHMNVFSHEVLKGECYFYKVLAPESATLRIALEGEQWVISTIQGQGGIKVQDHGIQAEINAWLLAAPEPSGDIESRREPWRQYLSQVARKAGLAGGFLGAHPSAASTKHVPCSAT